MYVVLKRECSVKLKRGCPHELPDEIAMHGPTSHFALHGLYDFQPSCFANFDRR